MAAAAGETSVSVQHGKRERNQSRGAFNNSDRRTVKGGPEGTNNNGANGPRVPGKRPPSGQAKRPWRPNAEQKVFRGSAKEGQGFTLWRKRKVQLEYKKLQRKQKKINPQEVSYSEHYPEHLKHLYLAEEKKLKSQEKLRRSKNKPLETGDKKEEVIPKKTFKKKTSCEIYEQVKQEREKKREEAQNNRKKKEEAHKLYLKRRKEAYKVLCSKTKKGQPNFNVQMEYLLKKISSNS